MSSPESSGDSLTPAEIEYRRLLDQSLLPVCIHDGTNVRFANRAALRALGATSPAELVDRPIADFMLPASLDAVNDWIARWREDGDASPPRPNLAGADRRHRADGPGGRGAAHGAGHSDLRDDVQ